MPSLTPESTAATTNQPVYSLWQLVLYFLRLGTIGFGGPVALVGYMHRDLVERRHWISDEDYKEGLALAQLAPGPLAAQLGIYLGFVHYRIRGATLVWIAFVLPSFLMVLALSAMYVRFGGLPWMQAAFYGVGACVIGIIALSAYKLTLKTIGKDTLLWAIFLLTAATTIITKSEKVWLFLIAGIVVWLVKAPPKALFQRNRLVMFSAWSFAPLAVLGAAPTIPLLWTIFLYFLQAGAFVFGSGLAILPFLYGGVVQQHHWLNDRQFLDAVAIAMITPGPVVITTGFIGFLIAGFVGAVVAAFATFAPCYLFTIIPAPYFKKYGRRPDLVACVKGVTAAAAGAITGAVVVLGERSITDVVTAALAVVTLALLWKWKNLPEPVLIIVAAVIGVMLYPGMRP